MHKLKLRIYDSWGKLSLELLTYVLGLFRGVIFVCGFGIDIFLYGGVGGALQFHGVEGAMGSNHKQHDRMDMNGRSNIS